MAGSQPQGQRSGEGTSGLWNHIRDDDQCKDKEPDRRSNDDARQQYAIKADPAGFGNETRKVFGALAKRIERENNELYPLADKSS